MEKHCISQMTEHHTHHVDSKRNKKWGAHELGASQLAPAPALGLFDRGWSALTTMLMFGRKSASYCTHNAATAAICTFGFFLGGGGRSRVLAENFSLFKKQKGFNPRSTLQQDERKTTTEVTEFFQPPSIPEPIHTNQNAIL